MNRYKEKYAGASAGQPSAGDKRPRDGAKKTGPAGTAQSSTAPSRRPGILDRIKKLFGVGKDQD
jgi:hypothetical protein